jgi:response regulator RpfG family c-di-GMP phosphodiesterase
VLLVVESDESHFILLEKSLRRWGVECPLKYFPDSKELFDHLLKIFKPKEKIKESHIILVDTLILETETYDFLKLIKENTELEHIPIVILGSSYDIMTIRRCFELGCNGYLVKPVGQREFMEVFEKVCEQNLLENPGNSNR